MQLTHWLHWLVGGGMSQSEKNVSLTALSLTTSLILKSDHQSSARRTSTVNSANKFVILAFYSPLCSLSLLKLRMIDFYLLFFVPRSLTAALQSAVNHH
jgi:hypothetical protein